MHLEKKDIFLLIPASLLAIAGLGPDDPWIIGPCLLLSWAAFVLICILHEGSRTGRSAVAVTLTLALGFVGYRRFSSIFGGREKAQAAQVGPGVAPPPTPQAQLAMQCEQNLLPIAIAPHDEALVLELHTNPEFMNRLNDGDKELHWPTPNEAQLLKHDPNLMYKCHVESLRGPVEQVAILLSVSMGKKNFVTTISFAFIEKDKLFYIINQCPVVATIIIPNTARAKTLDETSTREIPLHGAPPNSIGKLMMFFPSRGRWANHPKCD